VRIKPEEVAERLHSDDRAGDGFLFRHYLLHKDFQRFPGTAAEGGKKFPVVKKIPAQDLRDAEDKMPVGHFLENVQAEPFPKLYNPFLVTGRAEVAALTREGQQVFMAAVFAFHTGKTVVQIAAIKVAVDYLFDIRPPETVIFGKPVIINLHEGFKPILYAVVIIRVLRVAWPVNGCWR